MRLPAPLTQGSLWGGAKKTPRRGCLLEYGGLFAAALFVLQAAAAGAGVIAAGLLFIGLQDVYKRQAKALCLMFMGR